MVGAGSASPIRRPWLNLGTIFDTPQPISPTIMGRRRVAEALAPATPFHEPRMRLGGDIASELYFVAMCVAVRHALVCCAVIPLGIGIAAFLGFSKKEQDPANQEETIPQEERY